MPSCLAAAETEDGHRVRTKYDREHLKVTGEVVAIHEKHGWFRVKYRLPGTDCAVFECFPIRSSPQEQPKYGYQKGEGSCRRRNDHRYDY